MKKTKFLQKNAGLTLIETTIAIFIVTVGLVGGLSLAIYSTSLTHQIEERTIAYYLAQEGIELVRGKRDSAWLEGANLFTGAMSTPRTDSSANYYILDYTGLLGCKGVGGCTGNKQLYLDSNGFYQHGVTGTRTPYSRAIRKTVTGGAVVIVSEVTWGDNKIVKLEEDFYNWRDLP